VQVIPKRRAFGVGLHFGRVMLARAGPRCIDHEAYLCLYSRVRKDREDPNERSGLLCCRAGCLLRTTTSGGRGGVQLNLVVSTRAMCRATDR
jgi:hypothetical protein